MDKLKSWFQSHKQQIVQAIMVALIALLSFSLGYLIRGEIKKSPIIIEKYSKN